MENNVLWHLDKILKFGNFVITFMNDILLITIEKNL